MVHIHSDGPRPPAPPATEDAAKHVLEEGDEGAADLGAAEAVDVEVEGEVEQLQVVRHSSENLGLGPQERCHGLQCNTALSHSAQHSTLGHQAIPA